MCLRNEKEKKQVMCNDEAELSASVCEELRL